MVQVARLVVKRRALPPAFNLRRELRLFRRGRLPNRERVDCGIVDADGVRKRHGRVHPEQRCEFEGRRPARVQRASPGHFLPATPSGRRESSPNTNVAPTPGIPGTPLGACTECRR